MLDGDRIGNCLLRRELHFFASITSQGLFYEATQQQTHFSFLHHYIEETWCPTKWIQKICAYSPTHTTNWTSDDTSDDTLPDSPPKTNTKNLRTLTPILEVRTPIAKAIWACGKNRFSWLFQDFRNFGVHLSSWLSGWVAWSEWELLYISICTSLGMRCVGEVYLFAADPFWNPSWKLPCTKIHQMDISDSW